MKTLSPNWITEKHIDFEYKKYLLLAYLKEVSENFEETKLYPFLSDLISHYRGLIKLKENKENLASGFSERIRGMDFENFKIIYEKLIQDDAIMQELETIIDYSIPQFELYLAEGKKIYDFIEEHLYISPVGIIPLNPFEGYFFLQDASNKYTKVYEYQITIFNNPDERYRGIHTHYIKSYRKSITNTFESIKIDLIKYYKKLPNPATYVIEADIAIPLEETFLPIAKRFLVKHVVLTE